MPESMIPNALAPVQAFQAGREMRTTARVGEAMAGGDMRGAQRAAFQGGNLQQGQQIGQVLAQMSEQERAQAMQRAQGLGQIAQNLQSMPYEQRRQVLGSPVMQQQLSGLGLDPAMAANFDPTDENIAAAMAPVAQIQAAAEEQTSAMREYNLARQQGFEGTFMDFDQARRSASRQQTNVNVNTGTAQTPDQMVRGPVLEATGDRIAAIRNAASAASRNQVRLNRLESILEETPQGAEGAFVQIAGNLGVPISNQTDNVQAAVAIINSMVPEQRPPGSGVMSDADLELFKQSLPRIINQPGGNRLILETMRSIINYDIELGRLADAFEAGPENGGIGLQEYRRRVASLSNPIESFQQRAGRYSGGQGSPSGQQSAEPLNPEERREYDELRRRFEGGG